jgi:hypothetical protein
MTWMKHQISPHHKIYVPKNIDKFVGNYAVCRSSWEEKFCKWCDKTDSVALWSSESIAIQYQYLDPITHKVVSRRYFPDFVIKTNKGETFIIEIKPYKETVPPVMKGRKKKTTYLTESKTYTVNMAKWRAAQNYCEKHGYQFKIITERALPV